MARRLLAALASSCTVALAVVAGASAANPTATQDAGTVAAAIVRDPATLTGASFQVHPGPSANSAGTAPAVGPATALAGSTLGVLETGRVQDVEGPQSTFSSVNLGNSARGANDVTVLRMAVNVPAAANCLAIAADYFSEDFPTPPTSLNYQDYFLAEVDPASPWSLSPTGMSAPANFAFDNEGDAITAASQSGSFQGFNGSPTSANSTGTVFNGALGFAYAMTPITPGAHNVDLSISDGGDPNYDTLVALDDLRFVRRTDGHCSAGPKVAPDLDAPAVTITSPVGGSSGPSPALAGSAGTGAGDSGTVTVRIHSGDQAAGAPVQSLSPGVAGGRWQATPAPLAPGTYTAQAEQVDAAGNIGLSAPTTFTVVDGTAPVFLSARAKPAQFKRGKGTTFVFSLSEAARVTFKIERKKARKGRRARFVKAGTFGADGVAGRNRKRFSGKFRRKALKPGSYRATLTARDAAGNKSKAKRLNLKIIR